MSSGRDGNATTSRTGRWELKLDTRRPLPEVIEEKLRELIDSGVLPPEERLPNERCSTTDKSTRANPGLPHHPHRTAIGKPIRPNVKHQVGPKRQASAGTAQSVCLVGR
jgi:hypothetical protein